MFRTLDYSNEQKKLDLEAIALGEDILSFFRETLATLKPDIIIPADSHVWSLLKRFVTTKEFSYDISRIKDYKFSNLETIENKRVLILASDVRTGDALRLVGGSIKGFKPAEVITAAYSVSEKSTLKPDFCKFNSLPEDRMRKLWALLLLFQWQDGMPIDPDFLTIRIKITPEICEKTFHEIIGKLGPTFERNLALGTTKIIDLDIAEDVLPSFDFIIDRGLTQIRFFFFSNNEITLTPIAITESLRIPRLEKVKKIVSEQCFLEAILSSSKANKTSMLFIDWVNFKLTCQLLDWFVTKVRLPLSAAGYVFEPLWYDWIRFEARFPNCHETIEKTLRRILP